MNCNHKIKTLDEVAGLAREAKLENRRVVHCHGVFDVLHIGHYRYFQEARDFGDILVVTVTPDQYVRKGPDRPAFTEDLRAEAISMLECVDYVVVNQYPTAVEAINLIRPTYYIKGPDYRDVSKDRTGGILEEENAVKAAGGQIVFTNGITHSSSNIINRYFSTLPHEVERYLENFKKKYDLAKILNYVDGAKKLRVLVLGETIIDEYNYCQTLGKSGKEPILATRLKFTDKFAGGVLAVANHIAAICPSTQLLTYLGEKDSQEAFIRESLSKHVTPHFLFEEEAPTMVKKRFLESYPLQKMFEVYVMGKGESSPEQQERICEVLEKLLPKIDAVIVTDYGHGMIGPEAVNVLCEQAKFLAVNTQINAHNIGYNTISKYKRADYICVSENEMRMEVRSRSRAMEDIMREVSERLSCQKITVTKGKLGTLCLDGNKIDEVPALTSKVVDRIGAGDAVFAVAALLVAQQAPMEVVGLVANAVGSEAVAILGNQRSIDPTNICKHLEALLK